MQLYPYKKGSLFIDRKHFFFHMHPILFLNIGNCDPGWDKIGTMCYKRLRHLSSGLRFKDAKILCSTENAYIMMPQSQIEAQSITSALDCGT